MEYTNKEYLEDVKLAIYTINTMFKTLKLEKEDLVQECVIKLWKARERYTKDKGGYSNFAINVCKNNILNIIREKEKSINDVSLNDVVKEDITFEELQSCADDLSDVDCKLDVLNAVKDLLNKEKTTKKKKIYKYLLNNHSSRVIARNVGCSISYVNMVKLELKDKLTCLLH